MSKNSLKKTLQIAILLVLALIVVFWLTGKYSGNPNNSAGETNQTEEGLLLINKDSKNLIRNTNNRLRKNWRILEDLNPEEKTKTSRSKLIEKGFDFSYFTSIYTTKIGTVYYFVYNQGYLPLDNDYYALVKRKE